MKWVEALKEARMKAALTGYRYRVLGSTLWYGGDNYCWEYLPFATTTKLEPAPAPLPLEYALYTTSVSAARDDNAWLADDMAALLAELQREAEQGASVYGAELLPGPPARREIPLTDAPHSPPFMVLYEWPLARSTR